VKSIFKWLIKSHIAGGDSRMRDTKDYETKNHINTSRIFENCVRTRQVVPESMSDQNLALDLVRDVLLDVIE
jgi:hypothetical protein